MNESWHVNDEDIKQVFTDLRPQYNELEKAIHKASVKAAVDAYEDKEIGSLVYVFGITEEEAIKLRDEHNNE